MLTPEKQHPRKQPPGSGLKTAARRWESRAAPFFYTRPPSRWHESQNRRMAWVEGTSKTIYFQPLCCGHLQVATYRIRLPPDNNLALKLKTPCLFINVSQDCLYALIKFQLGNFPLLFFFFFF